MVCREAHRRGLHFVLYSGSPHALESARENHILALTKPAAIEEIYAALTHPRPNFANAQHFSQEKCMLCQQPTYLGQNLLDSSLSGNVGSLSNERINYHATRERPGKCP